MFTCLKEPIYCFPKWLYQFTTRTWTAPAARVMTLSPSLFEPLIAGDQILFGQSVSVAPPVQAPRGLLCLGSFSVVWHIKHIEGLSWLGFYSVNQHVPSTLRGTLGVGFSVVRRISHLKEHPGWDPALQFIVAGV